MQTLAFGRIAGKPSAAFEFAPQKRVADYNVDAFKDPRVLGQAVKQDFLFRADQAARKISDKVVQVGASVTDSCSAITLMNSEGLNLSMNRARLRVNVTVTVSDGTERLTTHEAPGALGGYELLTNYSPEELSTEATERLLRMLSAGYIKGGQMPVVMGNGFGGVIFHEACGHPLEASATAKGLSVFSGKIGQQIASSVVSAYDDGTIPNEWGSTNIDSEGVPTKKNMLIKNGICVGYMVDRTNGRRLGMEPNGTSRRQSYKYEPTSRMSNTYICKGESDPKDIIADTEYGLYCTNMGGGSVDTSTGDFNFAVNEAYMIRNGKIAEPVRGATLIGKGQEILKNIDMVGNDLEISAGMCGSVSGGVPVTVGQPTIRVSSILVGGREA